MGTNPYLFDSDGDLITDTLEIEGFTFNSQQFYSDPLNRDTNEDGQIMMSEYTSKWTDSLAKEFSGIDSNQDGILSPSECLASKQSSSSKGSSSSRWSSRSKSRGSR